MKHGTERRLYAAGEVEVRATAEGGAVLTGYAAVFNRYSQDLGGFVEQAAPGAFAKTVAEGDIRALVNHDPNRLLGRTRSGTLRLAEDTTGLHYEVDLPSTRDAIDVRALAERGDLTGSSFTFRAMQDGDEWSLTEQEYPLRTLTEVRLYDVGPVTFPAYLSTEEEQTALAMRSLAAHLDITPEAVAAAADLRALIKGEGDESEGPEQHSTSPDGSVARALARLEIEAALGAE